MIKCDMCYDRTSVGKRPMCATVCPSEALYFGSLEEWKSRRHGRLVNQFRFGRQTVKTGVYLVMPETPGEGEEVRVDVRLGDIQPVVREEAVR